MKYFLTVCFLLLACSIFAASDPHLVEYVSLSPSDNTVSCKKAQAKMFRRFLEDKKQGLKGKITPSKDDYDCVNYGFYKVFEEIMEIEKGPRKEFMEVCDVYFSYCNGKPQYENAELFGADVEAWYQLKVITCEDMAVALTMNRDECKRYFGIDKPSTSK